MTQQNTMPDVIYLAVTHDHKDCLSCEAYYSSSDVDGFEGLTGKYIRADLYNDLLKQAREAMYGARFHKTNEHVFAELNKAIRAIDKALGETK